MTPQSTQTRETLLQKAIECFRKAGNPAKIAECYEIWPKYLEAARIYEQEVKDFDKAAHCCRLGREYARAAKLYVKALNDEGAVECYQLANDFKQAGEILEHRLKDPERAVETYQLGALYYEAARLLETALGRPEKALACYLKELDHLAPGPSARRAQALFGAAHVHHAQGNEPGREDFVEQGERVAEQLADANDHRGAAAAFEALGDFGVRADRSHQVDTGFERALRHCRKASDAQGASRVIGRYLEFARRVGNRSLVERLEKEN